MKDRNVTAYEFVTQWKRVDFACAIVMFRARQGGDRSAENLYGIWPTDEQLAQYQVTDTEIDEVIARIGIRVGHRLDDAAISAGWEMIEGAVEDFVERVASPGQ